MTSISLLLVFFLAIGIFARAFNGRVRLILVVGIIGFLIYLYLA